MFAVEDRRGPYSTRSNCRGLRRRECRFDSEAHGTSGTTKLSVLFGGTLVPALGYTVTLTGSRAPLVHDASCLAALPTGFQVWAQAAFLDLTGPQGWTAADAVRVTRP